ncbi:MULTISPECIES: hypothetical protein [Lactobacillus]|uniref:Uncharacterized protein n=1 Tax=Lactobacillus xujianguonis TaxID=2495899 RepID=A0A437SSV0_9LACO|nr:MULTISPECIES: hypothetical protein [Lactobacillus]RVU69988.1 hypothetical protein EJK17_10085 [Lactobacillus xujianguonis]
MIDHIKYQLKNWFSVDNNTTSIKANGKEYLAKPDSIIVTKDFADSSGLLWSNGATSSGSTAVVKCIGVGYTSSGMQAVANSVEFGYYFINGSNEIDFISTKRSEFKGVKWGGTA